MPTVCTPQSCTVHYAEHYASKTRTPLIFTTKQQLQQFSSYAALSPLTVHVTKS